MNIELVRERVQAGHYLVKSHAVYHALKEGFERKHMTSEPIPICGEHQVKKEWRPTTFEYSDEGVTIRVPNVYAWVCPESGEASFTPETVDELITTVRELIGIAKRARERRPALTEYVVSVSV